MKALFAAGTLALLVTTAGGSTPASAEVKIDIKTEYYSVRGRTLEALDRSIQRNAPVLNGTERALGQARLNFKSKVRGIEENGECVVTDPGVDLSVVVVLPKWRDERRGNPDLRVLWNNFSGYVAAHEARHVKIAMKHAERLRNLFKRVPDAPTCQLLQMRLQAAAKKILSEHQREQLQFDAREQRRLARAIRRSLNGR